MFKRLRVVIISAEAFPFSGSGASEAVIRSLPEALPGPEWDVAFIVPKYRRPAIDKLALARALPRFVVPLGANKAQASVWRADAAVAPCSPEDAAVDQEAPARRFPVYFVENAKFFDRERIYGSENAPYPDNDERFTFFCLAAMEFLGKSRFGVDLIHCHDWPTALVPLFLRTRYAGRRHFRDTASVLTLHNPSAQGVFPPESLALTGLAWDFFTPGQLALNGKFNFVKAGFLFADALNAGNTAAAETVRSGIAGADLAAILDRRRREAEETAAKAPFKFEVPEAAGGYAGIYRQALEFRRGGSHVR